MEAETDVAMDETDPGLVHGEIHPDEGLEPSGMDAALEIVGEDAGPPELEQP